MVTVGRVKSKTRSSKGTVYQMDATVVSRKGSRKKQQVNKQCGESKGLVRLCLCFDIIVNFINYTKDRPEWFPERTSDRQKALMTACLKYAPQKGSNTSNTKKSKG